MSFATLPSQEFAPHLARLRAVRVVTLALLALCVMIAPALLSITLPQTYLLSVLFLAAGVTLLAHLQSKKPASASTLEHASANALCSQILFDLATLSAVIYLSGGATNPLISLLLPPVAFAALALPGRQVIAVTAAAVSAYSLLMLFYLPLPIADVARATQLHLIGMWLTFVVSAGLIGWIVLRMSQRIRLRDAELAAAREQALRAERVTAIGTLAAGAAHELGTPLATMALLVGEFTEDTRLPAETREDAVLLQQQIAQCKSIISTLSRRAGAERLENIERLAADRWLNQLRQHWHSLRPQANSQLNIASLGPAPLLAADPRLAQALLNLLNNAARASAESDINSIEIRLSWDAAHLIIEVLDRGPGFPPEVLDLCGRHALPAHTEGCGIGLLLTCSAINQLGGRLLLRQREGGGATARIELPRLAHAPLPASPQP
ncbi:ATP-binding protein [Azonexus sp.]|uniref:ATP-binding protein n=1 Tax=Azonexus sp. TaxID=1872668 RepID=UPI0039E3674C